MLVTLQESRNRVINFLEATAAIYCCHYDHIVHSGYAQVISWAVIPHVLYLWKYSLCLQPFQPQIRLQQKCSAEYRQSLFSSNTAFQCQSPQWNDIRLHLYLYLMVWVARSICVCQPVFCRSFWTWGPCTACISHAVIFCYPSNN